MSFSDSRSGGKAHSMREVAQRFCGQMPFLSPTSVEFTGPHPFFNHKQTPEGRDDAPFYVCSQYL